MHTYIHTQACSDYQIIYILLLFTYILLFMFVKLLTFCIIFHACHVTDNHSLIHEKSLFTFKYSKLKVLICCSCDLVGFF